MPTIVQRSLVSSGGVRRPDGYPADGRGSRIIVPPGTDPETSVVLIDGELPSGWEELADPEDVLTSAPFNRPSGARDRLLAAGVPGAGGMWHANQPQGWPTLTDHDWDGLEGNGWSYNPTSGEDRGFIHAVTLPDAHAAEFFYPEGHPNGAGVGRVIHYGVSGEAGLYVAFRVKWEPSWVMQNPAVKVMHIMMEDGFNVHLDSAHSDVRSSSHQIHNNQWALGPTAWGGADDGMNDWPNESFNNVNEQAAELRYDYTAEEYMDEWQVVELLLHRGSNPGSSFDGIVRMWVDGVLTADWDEVRFPSANFANLHFNGTYGGGDLSEVPQDQRFWVSDTFISLPEAA
jgi:hypothetical protein